MSLFSILREQPAKDALSIENPGLIPVFQRQISMVVGYEKRAVKENRSSTCS